tara:strand:+ start:645 stop:839 length:195 start_codon:yes stop_codon:yes gene_type:complete
MTVMLIVPACNGLLGMESKKALPVFCIGVIDSCWAISSVVRQAASWLFGVGLRIKMATLLGDLF